MLVSGSSGSEDSSHAFTGLAGRMTMDCSKSPECTQTVDQDTPQGVAVHRDSDKVKDGEWNEVNAAVQTSVDEAPQTNGATLDHLLSMRVKLEAKLACMDSLQGLEVRLLQAELRRDILESLCASMTTGIAAGGSTRPSVAADAGRSSASSGAASVDRRPEAERLPEEGASGDSYLEDTYGDACLYGSTVTSRIHDETGLHESLLDSVSLERHGRPVMDSCPAEAAASEPRSASVYSSINTCDGDCGDWPAQDGEQQVRVGSLSPSHFYSISPARGSAPPQGKQRQVNAPVFSNPLA